MKWIKDTLTDNEGAADIVSIMAAISCAVFIGLAIYTVVWRGEELDGQGFGIAIAAILGAAGGGYYMKSNTYSRYRRDDYERNDYRGNRRTDDLEG